MFPDSRRFDLGQATLSVHEAGEGTPVVLCHGFPELAYSWRHQIGALAQAGFRAIAPNQRGYADSSVPKKVEDYDVAHLTGDLVALLDALGIERAVFAGHDWGGFVAWAMTALHPDRCLGIIGVNTPYVPFPSTDQLRAIYDDDDKLYILWFQQPGSAETVLDQNVRAIFEKMMRRGSAPDAGSGSLADLGDANPFRRIAELEPRGETLLTPEDVDTYARAFETSGFFGPVSWYRNIDRNQTIIPGIGTQVLELPCLQVCAAWDLAIPPAMAAGMPAVCKDLEMQTIEACGHWTQQEKPEELNRLMIDWLRRKF